MTVDPVRLGTASEFLEFSDPSGRAGQGLESLTARVVGVDIDARAGIYIQFDVARLTGFFVDMEQYWRGWEGERRFESVESDLIMSARHDGRHIELVVSLNPDHYPGPGWKCDVAILVEPGEQLTHFVRDLREFLASGSGEGPERDRD